MTFCLFLCCFSFPPPSSPSLHTAICSSVNGRMLCGCDVVWLWSVCTATVVHSAYQPAASPCLDPAGCLPASLAGWLVGRPIDWLLRNWGGRCTHIDATTVASLSQTITNYPVAAETQASHQSRIYCSVFNLMPPSSKFSDNTTKWHLSSNNCSLQKTGQWEWLTRWLMGCVSPPDGSGDILCGAEDGVCIRMWVKSVCRLCVLAHTVEQLH